MARDALAVARDMMAAWEALDWNAVVGLFADDGVLEIVPARATYTGRAEIAAHLDAVASGIERLTFRVRQLKAADDVVLLERDDVFVYNGRESSVPCVGVMEIAGGRVQHWREYFDGATMQKALRP